MSKSIQEQLAIASNKLQGVDNEPATQEGNTETGVTGDSDQGQAASTEGSASEAQAPEAPAITEEQQAEIDRLAAQAEASLKAIEKDSVSAEHNYKPKKGDYKQLTPRLARIVRPNGSYVTANKFGYYEATEDKNLNEQFKYFASKGLLEAVK